MVACQPPKQVEPTHRPTNIRQWNVGNVACRRFLDATNELREPRCFLHFPRHRKAILSQGRAGNPPLLRLRGRAVPRLGLAFHANLRENVGVRQLRGNPASNRIYREVGPAETIPN